MIEPYKFETVLLRTLEYSDWECFLFGGTRGDGLMWRPLKGQEPNAFWRLMQFLVFGNRWRRVVQNNSEG